MDARQALVLTIGAQAAGFVPHCDHENHWYYPEPDQDPDDCNARAIDLRDPALPYFVAARLVDRVWDAHGLDFEVEAGHPNVCLACFTNEPTAKGWTVTGRGPRDRWAWVAIETALDVLDPDWRGRLSNG